MVSINNEQYPTLVEVKTEELGINMLVDVYNQIQTDYIKNINGGFRNEAKNNLNQMNEINMKLLRALDTVKSTMRNAYEKGIDNQQLVTINNPQLIEITNKLYKDETEIKNALDELQNAEADNVSSSRQRKSNLYKYVAMMVVSVITVGLTIRAFSSNESNTIETVILVLAIALVIYHLVDRYIL